MIASRVAGHLRVTRVHQQDGSLSPELLTNIGSARREPGSVLVGTATVLLAVLGIGLLAVSLAAQYRYVMDVKHEAASAWIEAAALDVGMAIFSLLALGLARAGQTARIERVLICVCAAGSAAMNYAASEVASPRSVLAFVMPPVFLAVVVDRVVAVVRRHVLGDEERSAWSLLGRVTLYSLRWVLAPLPTTRGLRRWVLASAPLPEVTASATPALQAGPVTAAITDGGKAAIRSSGQRTKKSHLLALYAEHPLRGDRGKVSRVAAELASAAGLQPGTARTYLYQEIDRMSSEAAA